MARQVTFSALYYSVKKHTNSPQYHPLFYTQHLALKNAANFIIVYMSLISQLCEAIRFDSVNGSVDYTRLLAKFYLRSFTPQS